MAVVISNNMVLTTPSQSGNAGVIGYQNLLNVSNVTATSSTATNPITNVANPATAYTWKSAIADYAGSISYAGTNLMPSPFDPSGWSGALDVDLAYQSVTETNPSGESFVGEFEYIGTGAATALVTGYNLSMVAGEYAYFSIISKQDVGIDIVRCFFQYGAGVSDSSPNIGLNGSGTLPTGWETKVTQLSGGYSLLQVKMLANFTDNYRCVIYLQNGGSIPTIGDKVKLQAAFFGKANDWPAVVDEGGVRININTAGQKVDYIGIARHNLNQVGLTVAVKYNGITVVPATSISDAQALLFLQNIAIPDNVELIIKGATVAPQIGVIYVGKSLRLERNIYVGHTPITYGRKRTSINGLSENGQYLGAIDVRQVNMTSVSLQNLTPIWYRTMLDPFFKLSPRPPCFWAWRPETYPDEVGFAWIEGDPSMSNQKSNGMVQADWTFKGTA